MKDKEKQVRAYNLSTCILFPFLLPLSHPPFPKGVWWFRTWVLSVCILSHQVLCAFQELIFNRVTATCSKAPCASVGVLAAKGSEGKRPISRQLPPRKDYSQYSSTWIWNWTPARHLKTQWLHQYRISRTEGIFLYTYILSGNCSLAVVLI